MPEELVRRWSLFSGLFSGVDSDPWNLERVSDWSRAYSGYKVGLKHQPVRCRVISIHLLGC